jgi:hypothetical protein
MYRQPSAQVFAMVYKWIHVYSRATRVRLDTGSFFRYQKFYGTDQIPESLRVGDEHIGPDRRSRVSRFRDETRLGIKKALMYMWKWLLFCKIRHDRRSAMPTNFRDYACWLPRIYYLIMIDLQFGLVTYSRDWEMKVPLECCNDSRTLICEKHVQRRLH